MIRAAAKAFSQASFAYMPGGAALYRELSRGALGTGKSHVTKQARVWPHYAALWQQRCGLELDGRRLWVHEPGVVSFAPFAAFLLSGQGPLVTNPKSRLLAQYVSLSVNAAMSSDFGSAERRRRLEGLRWEGQPGAAIAALGGRLLEGSAEILVPDGSIDICHSGGALEHYTPSELQSFLHECHRVLVPGGIASHVFDHRDHLHHADGRLPFLFHLGVPESVYRVAFGHRLGYHNRLSPTETAEHFRAAGFELIEMRRMIYPERKYVVGDACLSGQAGLARARLQPQYCHWSDADLRTAATHFLYRKPG